jgi:hypothetical protein
MREAWSDARHARMAEVRLEAGKSARLPPRRSQLTGSTVFYARDARFIVAQAALRGDRGVTTTGNPGNVGLIASYRAQSRRRGDYAEGADAATCSPICVSPPAAPRHGGAGILRYRQISGDDRVIDERGAAVTPFLRSRTIPAIGFRALLTLLLPRLATWRHHLGSDFMKSMSYRHAIALDAAVPRMRKLKFNQLLCCILALGFALSGIRAAHAQADPFQRYIIIYNDLPITIYPVITAVESQQGAACGTSGLNRRIIVNAGARGAGIPTNGTVTVELPKDRHCWYTAVRVYLFTVDLTKFEAKIPAAQRTVADNATWNPPLCTPVSACWTGTATDQYPLDAPAQLYEYTVISQNPANGAPFPDPNDPNGVPLADIDVSYVDELYLPVASNVDDGGATPQQADKRVYQPHQQQQTALV